jgi:hypothetical protein
MRASTPSNRANDPDYQEVFDHGDMRVEVWKDLDRNLWIE